MEKRSSTPLSAINCYKNFSLFYAIITCFYSIFDAFSSVEMFLLRAWNCSVFYQGLWDVERDSDGPQEGCILRVYVNVAFSKKTVWKGLPLLNADESLVYSVFYAFLVLHLCIWICWASLVVVPVTNTYIFISHIIIVSEILFNFTLN